MTLYLGDKPWAEATNGLMRRRDKVELIRQFAGMQLAGLARKLGLTGRGTRIDLDISEIPVPDSATCKAAETELAGTCNRMIDLHSHRTYYWGMILARSENLRPDPETLYVSALLHDLALADTELPKAKHCCFAVHGGRLADQFLQEQGWEGSRRTTVFEAISLHLNPDVPAQRHGPEARLLSLGAHLDVTGRNLHRISRASTQSVLQRFPRDGFATEIIRTITAGHHPDSRAGMMAEKGFEAMARANPLDR